MTQEDKELLLQDLCCRLPHGVKGAYILGDTVWSEEPEIIVNIDLQREKIWTDDTIRGYDIEDQDFKPYLRPLSSMTYEEKDELELLCDGMFIDDEGNAFIYITILKNHNPIFFNTKVIDWFNSHHFDYRGLIEKGLALEAPEGMYK